METDRVMEMLTPEAGASSLIPLRPNAPSLEGKVSLIAALLQLLSWLDPLFTDMNPHVQATDEASCWGRNSIWQTAAIFPA